MDGFTRARRMMVDGQIRTNDVTDRRVIAAFEEVPRERFVPREQAALAYLDRDLPIRNAGPGRPTRFLLKPQDLARLIQAAEIDARARVLVVGCGSGYSAAVLAFLAAEVIALEEDEDLAGAADENLRALGIENVTVQTGPLAAGVPAAAPYDVILIEGAVEIIPEALRTQLKDGGRLVCVLRDGPLGRGMLYRLARELSGRALFETGAHVLPGFARPPAFVF